MAANKLARIILTCSVVLCGIFSAAQQHHHSANPKKTVVDGAQHPELIPDTEAHRLFFSTVASNPQAFLTPVNLGRHDFAVVAGTVVSYQKAFKKLLTQQSGSADRGAQKKFLESADMLLKLTNDELQDKMTADGYYQLEAYIQSEKQSMTTTTTIEEGSAQ